MATHVAKKTTQEYKTIETTVFGRGSINF